MKVIQSTETIEVIETNYAAPSQHCVHTFNINPILQIHTGAERFSVRILISSLPE